MKTEIKIAEKTDAESIIDLIKTVFPKSPLVISANVNGLEQMIINKEYISIISRVPETEILFAHGGIIFRDQNAYLNGLVVNKKYRSGGIGKEIIERALVIAREESAKTVLLYCSLHNRYVQRYCRNFNAIGFCISENPFNINDPYYKKYKEYCEIALCNYNGNSFLEERVFKDFNSSFLSTLDYCFSLAGRTLVKNHPGVKFNTDDFKEEKLIIDIDIRDMEIEEKMDWLKRKDYVFAGILPNVLEGLKKIGFVKKDIFERYKDEFKFAHENHKYFLSYLVNSSF